MRPTFVPGDLVKVVSDKSYKPQRGDLVVFYKPDSCSSKISYIKRCVAIAGDKFNIKKDKVFINGKNIEEPYIKGVTNYMVSGYDKKIEGIVPEGFIIVLGDNRENSWDSRSFGYLDVELVIGKIEKYGFLK